MLGLLQIPSRFDISRARHFFSSRRLPRTGCVRLLLTPHRFGLVPGRSYRMFLSGYYIITSLNWRSYSTSELLNLFSLTVIISIIFMLLMLLAAGGLALALSVVFLIRSLLEGSATGIQFGKWLSRLNSTGRMRNLEVENKTAVTRQEEVRRGMNAMNVTNRPK